MTAALIKKGSSLKMDHHVVSKRKYTITCKNHVFVHLGGRGAKLLIVGLS